MRVRVCVSQSYLALQGTCSEKLGPAPQPERGPQESARRPTSARAAATGRPSYSLKAATLAISRNRSGAQPSRRHPTFFFAGGFGLAGPEVGQLNFPVYT